MNNFVVVLFFQGTHHIQQAGSCYDNGSCTLFCVLTRGSQIEGCAFIFHRMNDNKTLPHVYITAGEVEQIVLESGNYTIFVYSWDSGSIFHPPAITMQISVTNKRSNKFLAKKILLSLFLFFHRW